MIGKIKMIYRNYKELENIKTGARLWACAYEFDNNKITMGLISKPIYGMARGYGWDYEEVTIKQNKASKNIRSVMLVKKTYMEYTIIN